MAEGAMTWSRSAPETKMRQTNKKKKTYQFEQRRNELHNAFPIPTGWHVPEWHIFWPYWRSEGKSYSEKISQKKKNKEKKKTYCWRFFCSSVICWISSLNGREFFARVFLVFTGNFYCLLIKNVPGFYWRIFYCCKYIWLLCCGLFGFLGSGR